MSRSEALLVNAAIWVGSILPYRLITAIGKNTVSLCLGTGLTTRVVIAIG